MTLLETYVPVFQFREFHQLSVEAAPADLLDAVSRPGIMQDPWVTGFIRLREMPGRLLSALGRHSLLRDKKPFGLDAFTRLGRDADREIAFGLVGRFWRFDYGLVALGNAQEFQQFSDIGVPKLALNFSVVRSDAGHMWLRTETRVFCNDRKSRMRFLPYWCLIRPVSGLMRRRLLRRIAGAAAGIRAGTGK
jgi:hypothetical protein